MKWPIALLLILSLLTLGCAKNAQVQVPTIPPGPDLTKAIEAVTKSDIPADQKAATIKELLASAERMYQMTLVRASEAGKNVKDTALSILSLIGTGVGIGVAATR